MKNKYNRKGAERVDVRMLMTPNEAMCDLNPRYDVQVFSHEGRSRYDEARFDVRKRRIGYSINMFSYNGLREGYHYVGFALTVKGADKVARRKALTLAQRIAKESGDLPVSDKSIDDLQDLIKLYREKGWDREDIRDTNGYEGLRRKFAFA